MVYLVKKVVANMQYPILLLLLMTNSLTSSCGTKRRPSAGGGPYKAIVVALTGVDSTGSARFGLVEKAFPALNDLDNLDGTYLRILRGGDLTISEVNGSIVSADSFTGGSSPNLRYTLDGDVVIASDYSSLAMLSAYFQMDYVYSKVNDVLGINPTKLQEKLPGGKHTVLFEPLIVFKLDSASGNAGIKLNAAFSPKDKQFLLFQRSGIENIPLAGNLQVISHEFGHSVFDYSFFGGVFDPKNYLGDTYAIRGLNEGWADFVSWNFTGSNDILRSSITINDVADERFFSKTTFKWNDIVAQSLNKAVYDSAAASSKCLGSFYCIGTILARSLLEAKSDLPAVDSKTFANGLVVSLQSAQAEIKAMPVSIVPVATEKESSSPDTAADWTKQGQFTGAFLRAFIKNAPADIKTPLCTRISANFNGDGFSDAAKSGVCP
ncbi:MAG: hypothetical protein NTV34_15065 [Proteobacteria bacterium]|nr:hypothetical protein [Pseudomonadota bacterium]